MLEKGIYREEGYIGEEFFADPAKERLHKCMVVEQAISEGYFSFNDALSAYEMDREEYEQYIARKSNDVIFLSITGGTIAIETKVPQTAYFEVFSKMVDQSANGSKMTVQLANKIKQIAKQLLDVSKEIDQLDTVD